MVEDLKMCHESLVFIKRNQEIVIKADSNCYSIGKERVEVLKDWLEEATQLRYYVVGLPDTMPGPKHSFVIKDRENDNKTLVTFHIYDLTVKKGFDARSEAEKLCKKLNEGEN